MPWNGASRAVSVALPSEAGVASTPVARSRRQIQTRSSWAGWRLGLSRVPESAPKFGETVETPQSRAGARSMRWTARRSPALTPSTAIGPTSGLTFGKGARSRGFWPAAVIFPPKASSVKTAKGVRGRTVIAGAWPPK